MDQGQIVDHRSVIGCDHQFVYERAVVFGKALREGHGIQRMAVSAGVQIESIVRLFFVTDGERGKFRGVQRFQLRLKLAGGK